MDDLPFSKTLQGIYELNAEDGPHTNIFEPKFKARDQALILQKTIKNCLAEDKTSFRAQDQLAQLYLFIGNNMVETEEDKEGLQNLLRAYACVEGCLKSAPYDPVKEPVADLTSLLLQERPLSTAANGWSYAATYAEVLNSLGVYFANREDMKHSTRIDDARRVLHVVEELYKNWDADHSDTKIEDVPLLPSGLIDSAALEKLPDAEARKTALRLRHRMESIHTSNLFYLAQAYQARGDPRRSSKYCHLTLANQLRSKKEFSKKDWATNVLHLSAFYSGEGDWGASRYCLEAGKYMMPEDKSNPEDTTGFLIWTLGKFYKNRLRYYGDRKLNPGAYDEHLHRAEWWCDFNLPIPKPADLPKIDTVEQAREEFKLSRKYMEEALTIYKFDGACTDHIAIHQDLCDLYNRLMAFETDFLRQISIQMRRVELIQPWAPQLNFNSYGTLVRQLRFDLGDLLSDLLDMRFKQKEKKLGKRLSDKQLNALQHRAQQEFISFIESYRENGVLPAKFAEKEFTPAFFRALMRIARLETRRVFPTPQEEYEGIKAAIKRYQATIKFADDNQLEKNPELKDEVKVCRELMALLPTKQKDIWRTYSGAPQ
jgi:hypothetical protein